MREVIARVEVQTLGNERGDKIFGWTISHPYVALFLTIIYFAGITRFFLRLRRHNLNVKKEGNKSLGYGVTYFLQSFIMFFSILVFAVLVIAVMHLAKLDVNGISR